MITVFTVVYNNYGHFIPQWIEWLNKQTLKPKILIVLGKEHGANIEWLEDNEINYVLCDSDNMGVLRNAGLKEVKTEWWLYFSVDDELLPNACEEIINTDADAVSLIFDAINPDGSISKECHSPCINTIDELNNWKRCWGGYVAVKGNKNIRFNEDIEVPNLTLHFELFRRGLKTVRSNGVSAIHHRWSESHHYRSSARRKEKVFAMEINDVKNKIIAEMFEKSKSVEVIIKNKFHDLTLLKKGEDLEKAKKNNKLLRKRGDVLIIPTTRAKQLIDNNYAVFKKIIK